MRRGFSSWPFLLKPIFLDRNIQNIQNEKLELMFIDRKIPEDISLAPKQVYLQKCKALCSGGSNLERYCGEV